jgi:hypothetical protein
VEAVCNDLTINGHNLEQRISDLARDGYISKKDSERLHGIRFMGNDAAHEIKTPKAEQLSVALRIVEHLLASVYILEKEADGRIDAAITEFTKFEDILTKFVNQLSVGDELPLVGIFGTDFRRIKESMSNLERELINRINSGNYSNLSLGKVAKYQSSTNELQHYVVA